MTKQEALVQFRECYSKLLDVHDKHRDKLMFREAWNNFTDGLCKDGQITTKQYNTWTNPF